MVKRDGSMAGSMFFRRRQLIMWTGITSRGRKDRSSRLTKERQLMGYRHERFWSCMDTLKEKTYLEDLWQSGKAPWKIW